MSAYDDVYRESVHDWLDERDEERPWARPARDEYEDLDRPNPRPNPPKETSQNDPDHHGR